MNKIAELVKLMESQFQASSFDAAAGKDFKLPYIPSLSFMHDPVVPKATTFDLVASQGNVLGPSNTALVLSGIRQAGDGPSGMITPAELMGGMAQAFTNGAQAVSRGAVGGLTGLAAGTIVGGVLSSIGMLPPETRSSMARYGMIGGALLNSGALDAGRDAVKNWWGGPR